MDIITWRPNDGLRVYAYFHAGNTYVCINHSRGFSSINQNIKWHQHHADTIQFVYASGKLFPRALMVYTGPSDSGIQLDRFDTAKLNWENYAKLASGQGDDRARFLTCLTGCRSSLSLSSHLIDGHLIAKYSSPLANRTNKLIHVRIGPENNKIDIDNDGKIDNKTTR